VVVPISYAPNRASRWRFDAGDWLTSVWTINDQEGPAGNSPAGPSAFSGKVAPGERSACLAPNGRAEPDIATKFIAVGQHRCEMCQLPSVFSDTDEFLLVP